MSEPILTGLGLLGDAITKYTDSKEPDNNLLHKRERQLDDTEAVANRLYTANRGLSETALQTKLKLSSVSEAGMSLSSMYDQLKEMYVRLLTRSEEIAELNRKLYEEVDRRGEIIAALQEELESVKSQSSPQRSDS